MCSAVQGQGSALSPASPEQSLVNCVEGDIFINCRNRQGVGQSNCVSVQRAYIQGKLLAQPASVLLLGFHGVKKGKFNDVGPGCRTGTPAQTADGNEARWGHGGGGQEQKELRVQKL